MTTMTTKHPDTDQPANRPDDRAADLMAAARRLAPELSKRAEEAEAAATMPADLVAAMREAGLLRAAQARAYGGAELAPAALVELFEELSRADGAAGWTAVIGNGAPAFASWLDPAVGLDLLGADADFTSASVFAPSGRARPTTPGRLIVDGAWQWASGAKHASWFANGVLVADDGTPRIIPGQGPDWRLAYLPAGSVEVVDNWDALGMRGSGSHDVVARGVDVAEEHTIRPFFEPARQDGPLWRLPFFTLISVCLVGVPLGIGRRALDEVTDLMTSKIRVGTSTPVSEDPTAQGLLARGEASLQSARAFVFDTLDDVWQRALAGDGPTVDQRARVHLATHRALEAALEAADIALQLGGGGVVRAPHPIQRCFRDVNTIRQHVHFSNAAMARFAKTRLGIDQPGFGF